MSVDTILYALTEVEHHYTVRFINSSLTFDQRHALSINISILRDYLKADDADGFDGYINSLLAHYPDRADFLLDALYDELGITEREQLSTLVRAS